MFKSWNGRRARDYRRMEKIPDDLGTAVNVQTMVFGNKGDDSGTGVAFTRNPSSGENVPYGDFLTNAQGEDVVAGIRITEPLAAMGNHFPECHEQLINVMHLLENHYRDMCDIEFTIEQGRLFILQTRVGKRTAAAALRMAVEMEAEGLIDRAEAVKRVQPAQLDQLLHPQFDPKATFTVLAKGLERVARRGRRQGVLHRRRRRSARRSGGEGHPRSARDVARRPARHDRGRGHPHVARRARRATPRSSRAAWASPRSAAPTRSKIDLRAKEFSVDGTVVHEGDVISMSGSSGEIVCGEVAVVTPEPTGHFGTILGWADELRTLKVRTNADLPEDAAKARRVRCRRHRPVPHRAHVPR